MVTRLTYITNLFLNNMICPKCKTPDTKVIDSRVTEQGRVIRRRRECEKCGRRYTTFERAELGSLMVKKKDGTFEPYNRTKLEQGLWIACGKRPVTKDEIDQMVKDAERHQEEDTQQKQRIEARNQADNLVFAAEKLLKEQGDQISSEIKADVESKIAATQKALEGDDIDAINQAAAELGQAVQQIGASMYGDPAAAAGGATPGADDADGDSGASDEDVVEGEFSEAEE
jgi:transcriptional regulator NrdR